MRTIPILFALFWFQQEIPYKASDEFLVKINLQFKEKTSEYNNNTFSGSGERLDKSKGQKAFLEVLVTQLKIREDEVRITAVDSNGKELLRRKVSPVPELKFPMGFVEDLKAKSNGEGITVYFLSADKKKLRKIVFGVQPDGVFQVNGQWHGQF